MFCVHAKSGTKVQWIRTSQYCFFLYICHYDREVEEEEETRKTVTLLNAYSAGKIKLECTNVVKSSWALLCVHLKRPWESVQYTTLAKRKEERPCSEKNEKQRWGELRVYAGEGTYRWLGVETGILQNRTQNTKRWRTVRNATVKE